MAQTTYLQMVNEAGAPFRLHLNEALAAITTDFSGATAPSSTEAYMTWLDTSASPPVVRRRNSINTAWVVEYSFITGVAPVANEVVYCTGTDTYGVFTVTSAARSLLDDTSSAAMRTTLGAAAADNAALTGVPTAPTASAGTNTTQIATTAFVTTAGATKAPIDSPTFTGTPLAPTPSNSDASTRIATTAFVHSVMSNKETPNMQLFTSSGTFTVPSGVTRVKVTCVGGGGGGGGWYYNAEEYYHGGGGGGSGLSEAVVSSLTGGSTISVTVGNGGTAGVGSYSAATAGGNGGSSSFGSYVIALGGTGGGKAYIGVHGGAGAGAGTGTGTLLLPGTPGESGATTGKGGDNFQYGRGLSFGSTSLGYGSGGAGGHSDTVSGAKAGRPGFVLVEW